jgi:hypothetical protein
LNELTFTLQVRVQSLDGEESLKAAESCEPRQKYRGHPTRRNLPHQFVSIYELSSRLEVV